MNADGAGGFDGQVAGYVVEAGGHGRDDLFASSRCLAKYFEYCVRASTGDSRLSVSAARTGRIGVFPLHLGLLGVPKGLNLAVNLWHEFAAVE